MLIPSLSLSFQNVKQFEAFLFTLESLRSIILLRPLSLNIKRSESLRKLFSKVNKSAKSFFVGSFKEF